MADPDRNQVAIEIEAMQGTAQPLFTTECSIYRVPYEIRKLNQAAYTPTVVSIGPLHHGDTKLLEMEGHKQIYWLRFVDRSEASLDNLVNCVQELEPEVRRCYSENIRLSKKEFVKLILRDCGFIIELFLRYCSGERIQHDVILLTPWLRSRIRLDLLLLENQIPFFVFEKLYNLAFASELSGDHPSFFMLTFHYFKAYVGQNLTFSDDSVEHFTDLFRTTHLQPSGGRPTRTAELLTHVYSATELNEAGVKFRVNEGNKSFLDLQFSGRYLKISRLEVTDSTETLLRNMIALEQCHYPAESYITDYVLFLDFLINTDKDVDVLVKNGIIVNWLGDSKAAAELFNGLWKNILQESFNTDYLRIGENLNAYCKHPLHRSMATLRRDYCNTPWKTAASVAGIVLLILTVIQTVFSILQVVL